MKDGPTVEAMQTCNTDQIRFINQSQTLNYSKIKLKNKS